MFCLQTAHITRVLSVYLRFQVQHCTIRTTHPNTAHVQFIALRSVMYTDLLHNVLKDTRNVYIVACNSTQLHL